MSKFQVIMKRILIRTFEVEASSVAEANKIIHDYGEVEYFNDSTEVFDPSREELKDDCKIIRVRQIHRKD